MLTPSWAIGLSSRFKTARRTRRVAVELPAIVVTTDQRGHPGTVIDLSRGGARIEMRSPPRVGSALTLHLYGFAQGPMALAGDVVHATGAQTGIRFRESASLPRLVAVLAALNA